MLRIRRLLDIIIYIRLLVIADMDLLLEDLFLILLELVMLLLLLEFVMLISLLTMNGVM